MNKQNKQYPLNLKSPYLERALKVINSLYEIPRTGWVDRGVRNPETVGQHTDELIALADEYFIIHGLKAMLKIHDWAESNKKIGDARTDKHCDPSRRWDKVKKYQAELKTMQRICLELGPRGAWILKLWLEFEEGKTYRARIAKQLDKFQMLIKALEYQKMGEPVIAQEFIENDGPKVKHGMLREILEQAKKDLLG